VIHKRFDQIGKSDIESLIANRDPQGRTIEYKQSLPAGTDAAKKEFLADVSSFANAVGGDIVFGVQALRDGKGQPTGVPREALGLVGVNADAEIRRMEQMVQNGIAPRSVGIHTKAIEGFPDGHVLLMRIPQS